MLALDVLFIDHNIMTAITDNLIMKYIKINKKHITVLESFNIPIQKWLL